MSHHDVTLMEVLANFNEMEDVDYAFCWKNARETSSWPLQNPLELRLYVPEMINNDVLVHNVSTIERYYRSKFGEMVTDYHSDGPELNIEHEISIGMTGIRMMHTKTSKR